MNVDQNTKPEDIQRFIRKNSLKEAYECAGFLFRVKTNAEAHSKINKGAEIKVHAREEKPVEVKKSKAKGADNGLN